MEQQVEGTDTRSTLHQPAIGCIYRDEGNRSFMILNICDDQVLLEFADGAIKRISLRQWAEINPEPALC